MEKSLFQIVTLLFGLLLSVSGFAQKSQIGPDGKPDKAFRNNSGAEATGKHLASKKLGPVQNRRYTSFLADTCSLRPITSPSDRMQFCDGEHRISTDDKIAVPPVVITTAGSGEPGSDNGSALSSQFNNPNAVIFDRQGNMLVSDFVNHVIRKISPAGNVSTLAGTGEEGNANGPGNTAKFNFPKGLCLDNDGNLYVADVRNHIIRKITPDGFVSTFAGNGIPAWQDGNSGSASFNLPNDLTFDNEGNLYVADRGNQRIRKITPSGYVSTIAGKDSGFAEGLGVNAAFASPTGIVFYIDRLFIADGANHRIRVSSLNGYVSSVAGSDTSGNADGVGMNAKLSVPFGITADRFGNIYITDIGNHNIRKLTTRNKLSTVAGSVVPGFNDGPGNSSKFNSPTDLITDSLGNIYVSDYLNNRIRKITVNKKVDSYIWNTGANTKSILVSDTGHYSVRVVTGACTSQASLPVLAVHQPEDPIVVGIPFAVGGIFFNCTARYFRLFFDGVEVTNARRDYEYYPGNAVITYICTDSLTCEELASVSSKTIITPIKLFPNPGNEYFSITGIQALTGFELYNSIGQILISGKADANTQTDISALPSGIYYVHIPGKILPLVKTE
ncbi:MAG: T9SS type A sorting domain-containing protein [Bacteroidota bacterium]